MKGTGDQAEPLVRICDPGGRPRGCGFVADDRGTLITGHEVVAGLDRLVLHGPGGSTRTVGADAVTPLAEAGLALVRTAGPDGAAGLGAAPLPVTARERVEAGTYVRLYARGRRQARVLADAEVLYRTADGTHRLGTALELAIGTDGMDALRLGGEACGGPVLDAATGAVLAVVGTALEAEHRSGGFAIPLRPAAEADPYGPLAALLARNAETVPAHGPDLNLAAVLRLANGSPRPGRTVGKPTEPGRALGPAEPVVRAGTVGAVDAFLASSAVVLALVGEPGSGRSTELAALHARRSRGPSPAPVIRLRGSDLAPSDTSLVQALTRGTGGGAGGTGAGGGAAAGVEEIARVADDAGRGLVVLLDAPEEMPSRLARRLAEWTAATAAWLRRNRVRLVLATRPEFWERAEGFHPDGSAVTHLLGDLTSAEARLARDRYGIPAEALCAADRRHPLTLRLLAEVREAGVTAGRPGRAEVFEAHLDLVCLRAASRLWGGDPGRNAPGPAVRRMAVRIAGRVHEAARHCLGPGQGMLDEAAFAALFPPGTGWAEAVLAEELFVPAGAGHRFAHEEFADWLMASHLDLSAALDTLVRTGPTVPRHRVGPVQEALLMLAPAARAEHLTTLLRSLTAQASGPAGGPGGPGGAGGERAWWAARLIRGTLLRLPDALPCLDLLHALAAYVSRTGPDGDAGPDCAPGPDGVPGSDGDAGPDGASGPDRDPGSGTGGGTGRTERGDGFDARFWSRLRLPEAERMDLLRRLLPAELGCLDAAVRRLRRDPPRVQPLLCDWFADERRLRGRPGATVAAAAQALLHTHRRLAPDALTEALVSAAHPRADELLAVLAEEEPAPMARAVERWARDPRPERRVAAAAYGPAAAAAAAAAAASVASVAVAVPAAVAGPPAAVAADPADRSLFRRAALALLDRTGEAGLHGPALGMLLHDPETREAHVSRALTCPGVPPKALVAAADALPGRTAEVLGALRARADGRVLPALAELTSPGAAAHAAVLVREHTERHPGDAPHAAAYVDRVLERGPVTADALRRLTDGLLLGAEGVRAALAGVLGEAGAPATRPLRGELLDRLLGAETEPAVLGELLGAVARATVERGERHTRELVRRTGRRLLAVPGGAAEFERRTVRLAREHPPFGRLIAHWLREEPREASALLGPSGRHTVEALGARTVVVPRCSPDTDAGPRPAAWQS
ncbi:serine protease [Streptomyces sp. NPDC089799]|uniref:serine protease n=1 Tax=Streptomyces sp. NPDC089799 TaxID=3155066 RepID=UPI003425B19C